MSILDPKLWLGVLLAIVISSGLSFWKGVNHGKLLERATVAAAVSKANVEDFKTFERHQRNADEASSLAYARAMDDRARAAGADRVIGGLRNTLDATQHYASTSLDAATKTVAAYRAVLESCTAEYRSLGQEASGHASDSLMYQQAWPR